MNKKIRKKAIKALDLGTLMVFSLLWQFSFILHAQSQDEGFALQEVIRRKAEEAALTNCYIGGSKVCARQEVLEFYQKRLFLPVWGSDEKRAQLLEAIEGVARDGLQPRDYYYGELRAIHEDQGRGLELLGNREILFTDAFLLLSAHLSAGKVNPLKADPNWNISRESFSVADSLAHNMELIDLGKALSSLAPQTPAYQLLKQELQRYEALGRQGGWDAITLDQKLEVGAEDSAVLMLRKRLLATADFSGKHMGSIVYDSLLMESVKTFQERHGLQADGVVGKETLEALNISAEDRVSQIRVNLERYRWLPSEFSDYQIRVNIPEFALRVIDQGRVEREHRVIVGKSYRQTPVFSAQMQYLVFNPTWTVPPGILSNDVIPAAKINTSYLKKKGLNVYDRQGNLLNPDTINWSSNRVYRYTYRQGPGDDNALGRVKFIFPNSHMVYIHDTPTKYLFDRSERAFSSGCMRVENPMDLAKYLLRGTAHGSDQAIEGMLKNTTPRRVDLSRKPQVLVLYLTAWSTGGGMEFRKDVYDRDEKLLSILNASRPLD